MTAISAFGKNGEYNINFIVKRSIKRFDKRWTGTMDKTCNVDIKSNLISFLQTYKKIKVYLLTGCCYY